MAEKQANHRHKMDLEQVAFQNRILKLRSTESILGQVLAFVLAMAVILGGIYLVATDKSAAGLTAIITAAVALVSAFITGRLTTLSKKMSETRKSDASDTVEEN